MLKQFNLIMSAFHLYSFIGGFLFERNPPIDSSFVCMYVCVCIFDYILISLAQYLPISTFYHYQHFYNMNLKSDIVKSYINHVDQDINQRFPSKGTGRVSSKSYEKKKFFSTFCIYLVELSLGFHIRSPSQGLSNMENNQIQYIAIFIVFT